MKERSSNVEFIKKKCEFLNLMLGAFLMLPNDPINKKVKIKIIKKSEEIIIVVVGLIHIKSEVNRIQVVTE